MFNLTNGDKIRVFDIHKKKEQVCNAQKMMEFWCHNKNYTIQQYNESSKHYEDVDHFYVYYKLIPMIAKNYKENKFFNAYEMPWGEIFVVYHYNAGLYGDEKAVTHIKFTNKEEYNKKFAL